MTTAFNSDVLRLLRMMGPRGDMTADILIEILDGINDSQERTQNMLDAYDATSRWRRRRRLHLLAQMKSEESYREELWKRLGYPPEFWGRPDAVD